MVTVSLQDAAIAPFIACSSSTFQPAVANSLQDAACSFWQESKMLLFAGSSNAPFGRMLFAPCCLNASCSSWFPGLSSCLQWCCSASRFQNKPYLNWKRPRVESKLLKLPRLLRYTPLAGGGANWQWAVDSTLTVLWRFLWGQPLVPRQAMTAKRWANVFAGGLFSYCLCGRNCHCEGGHLTAFFVCRMMLFHRPRMSINMPWFLSEYM